MEKMIFINQKAYLNSLQENEKFEEKLKNYKDRIIVLPSTIYIKEYLDKGFIVGSQNISSEIGGAFTGEITAKALKDLNVKFTLIGHSEIRKKHPDEEKLINQKIQMAITNSIIPILCISEDNREKLKERLKEVPKNTIISYEPVWAIGSNKTPTQNQIYDIASYIKSLGFTKVLYGGSVNESTIEMLSKIKNIDGFLIGGCTLNPSSIIKIIEVVSE